MASATENEAGLSYFGERTVHISDRVTRKQGPK
jgi:hypothetical protein